MFYKHCLKNTHPHHLWLFSKRSDINVSWLRPHPHYSELSASDWLAQGAVTARCQQAVRNICEYKGPLHQRRLMFPPQFFASTSSQTSLRTEEELRNLGFHIEASGSCTVIRHILGGTPLFVGAVFTNAPTHSAAVARLQGLSNELDDEE